MACVSKTHHLLPFERRAAEHVLKEYKANPTGWSRREEYNLGTEGIGLRAAAQAWVNPKILVPAVVVLPITVVAQLWLGPTVVLVALGPLGVALIMSVGAFVRQTQVLFVSHSHRAGRRYLKTWEVPTEADASESAGPL